MILKHCLTTSRVVDGGNRTMKLTCKSLLLLDGVCVCVARDRDRDRDRDHDRLHPSQVVKNQ